MEIKGNNETLHLILKYYSNSNTFEDITKDVIYLKKDFNSWFIVFKNRKSYHMKLTNILVSNNPEILNIFNKNIIINSKIVNVKKIIKFDKIGYKVFIGENAKYYQNIIINNENIIINDYESKISNTNNVIFDYYKSLAKYASEISLDELSIDSLLYKLYEKIDCINTNSVLYSYTNQEINKRQFDINKVIYPFSTNCSQNKAIYNTFSNNISVISGPPGTGKTQVIMNIIANSIMQNKKIAVISNNNTAVENVYDKMKDYDLDFLLAYLGNKDNVEKFFLNNTQISEKIIKFQNFKNRQQEVNKYINIVDKLYYYSNKLKLIDYDIQRLEHEQILFNEKKFCIDELEVPIKNYDYLLKLKMYLMSLKKLNFFNKLILRFWYKIKINDYSDVERILLYLNKKSYDFKLEILRNEKIKIEKYIKDNNLFENEQLLRKYSFETLGNYLYNKYEGAKDEVFTSKTYKENFNKFIFRYPVTLSTTHSLLRNCPNKFLYDLVVIDEASQSDIMTSIITMHVAKNIVIIGDDKQLSQIDNEKIYDYSDKLATNYKIPTYFQYANNSILHSMLSLPVKVENTLLREHYRCEFKIIDFCNKKFYNDQLIICTERKNEDTLFIVHTVEGNHARKNPNGTGQYNDREAQEIIKIISDNPEKEIGVITPFRAQAMYITNLLKDQFPNVEIDTIHKFQGRQKDIIILSTVVNDLSDATDDLISNFITNPKLLNVAISRAKSKLYLITSDKVFKSSNNNISYFIDYIRHNSNNHDIKGNITSIFDELYKDNYKIIKSTGLCQKVDSYAENLMLNLLNIVLKNYPTLSIALHVNLLYLINDISGFTEQERKYITHPWTHVDFVIYDKITYRNILCIELDGTKYHDYNISQVEKDKIKTKVLEKNGVNFIRIRTNQSNEYNIIVDAINKNL